MPQTKELKTVEPFQSITDNTKVLGYDPTSNKYGLISVGKISRSQWCGCRWRLDSLSTEGEPVGSLPKIELMAELFGLGGYLVQNDHSRRKLSSSTHHQFAAGGSALLDGSMGHYQWGSGVTLYYAHWVDETYEYEAIDVEPIHGHYNYEIPVFSRSCAGYATIDRSNLRLVSYINSAAQYRGGNNDSSKDGAWNSLLGLPATAIDVPVTAAQYARANGTLWFANERVVFAITNIIKRIYFHNRNIQAATSNTLTADGLHQGGTGYGCDLPSDWSAWGYYPFLPLSAGTELGDYTGTFSHTINDQGSSRVIGGIPSFLGLKNDYKYLWMMEEDTLIRCESDGTQSFWVDNNIDGHTFDITTVNGHTKIGKGYQTGAAGWTYPKRINLSNLCNFPIENGGSGSTGYGDGYYNPYATDGRLRGALRFGAASDGDFAGSVCLDGDNGPLLAAADYGVCLCEFERAFSTMPSLVA